VSGSGEFNLHPTVTQELAKPTIVLQELGVGSEVAVVFGEGNDFHRRVQLRLRYKSLPTEKVPGKFEVLEAVLDPETVRLNTEAGMSKPELMGGEIWIDFACSYHPGYMPPITMARKDVISPGRHLFMAIPAPEPDAPDRWINYHAEVLEAEVQQ